MAADTLDRQWFFDWAPSILIIGGVILSWIGVGVGALITYLGFSAYGLLGFIDLFRDKGRKKTYLMLLKVAALALIVLAAVITLSGGSMSFMTLLLLVLLDRMILTKARLETD